jgi:hypothetical protein
VRPEIDHHRAHFIATVHRARFRSTSARFQRRARENVECDSTIDVSAIARVHERRSRAVVDRFATARARTFTRGV